MHVRKFVVAALVFILSASASAAGLDDATAYRVELIASFNKAIVIVGFMIGLLLTVSGGYKIINTANSQQKNKFMIPVMYILAGSLMMNLHSSISVLTNTYFKVNFCTMIDESKSISSSCFSDEISGVTGQLKNRIEKVASGSTAKAFIDNVKVIIGVFQVIGFIYFLVGIYGLVQVSNGSSKDGGYGKPIVTMVASALIVDIPHTAQTAIDTLSKIGINF
ncbi:hypothetical protein [Pseudomonas solani]|uniref:hypothetical protein n=1 Tax=Pseudomonas solani TaxID=2731552 RepID=UPI003C2BB970